jgi:hypothetical protein
MSDLAKQILYKHATENDGCLIPGQVGWIEKAMEEYKNKKGCCRVCGEETKTVFNINFKAVGICNDCSSAIFLQEAKWLVENKKA